MATSRTVPNLKIPDTDALPDMEVSFYEMGEEALLPYQRDPQTLARPWIRPGTAGAEHRIGGLEKQDGTGNVSYDPANHEYMNRTRAEKVARIADDIDDAEIFEIRVVIRCSWVGAERSVRYELRPWKCERSESTCHTCIFGTSTHCRVM